MSTIQLEKYESISYACFGTDVCLTIISLLQCFRVFKTKNRAFWFCLTALLFQICSTVITFIGGYWDVDNGAYYTTTDGCLYPMMVILTFFAYSERVITLEKLPHLNRFAKCIPIGIIILMIPDDASYILSAWQDDQLFIETMMIIDQVIYIICNIAMYSMLLSKMSRFLTVRKIKIISKVISVVLLLFTLDIILAVFSQINVDMYNAAYNLNFTIKMACVLHFYDGTFY
eukprot:NODE_175_length_14138_cov_1.015314.p7 type:complete len:230 gc:universal NODE_175_length_14138_cov_1.015314:6255-5566(-)